MDSKAIDLLLETWEAQTPWNSSPGRITGHPAYAELVSAGDAAAERVLDRMARGEARAGWFLLLHEITGADPVPPVHAGRIGRMAEDWLRWARDRPDPDEGGMRP